MGNIKYNPNDAKVIGQPTYTNPAKKHKKCTPINTLSLGVSIHTQQLLINGAEAHIVSISGASGIMSGALRALESSCQETITKVLRKYPEEISRYHHWLNTHTHEEIYGFLEEQNWSKQKHKEMGAMVQASAVMRECNNCTKQIAKLSSNDLENLKNLS